MKRIIITVGAALLVAVPATMGLVGNTSFAQSVPVRVPSQAIPVDDHGGQRATRTTEPRDDHGGQRATSTTEPRDDHGGQRATSTTGPGNSKVKGGGPAKGDSGRHGRTDGPGHT